MSYELFKVEIADKIAHVALNRPDKSNAIPQQGWEEMEAIFNELSETPEVRVIVLSGEGKNFCAGIDLSLLMSIRQAVSNDCEGRMREALRQMVKKIQAPITAIDKCRKPVLAAIHGACVGGGVDIVSACDMRYSTEDAYFTIREIDMGMVADIGTMQRLPKVIPDGMMREMAYTGRNVYGPEAKEIGLVNRTFANKEEMMGAVMDIAATIAAKSPLSIRGSKEIIRYARDHSVEDGLDYISVWNAAMILSNDLNEAFMATMEKRPPKFAD